MDLEVYVRRKIILNNFLNIKNCYIPNVRITKKYIMGKKGVVERKGYRDVLSYKILVMQKIHC